MLRFPAAALAAGLAFTACAGDRTRSPVCGLSQIVGPRLIQEQLHDPRAVLTQAPRGLPPYLPSRVVGQNEQARVMVSYVGDKLGLSYMGTNPPIASISDSTVYGVVVVDDTSQRVMGTLIYESARPRNYPEIGVLEVGEHPVPLFGLRVDWSGVNDNRCPLLGGPPPAPAATKS